MTAQTIQTPLRLNLAREQLRQRLAQSAGVDPFSGWFIGAMPDPDETSEERERRMSYLQNFRNCACDEIAGSIGGCALTIWMGTGDGSLAVADPRWSVERFDKGGSESDNLYLDQALWALWLATRFPQPVDETAADEVSVEEWKTGDPGRPSKSAELYLSELSRRIADGTVIDSAPEEASALRDWLKTTHPEKPLPTAGTIRNRIRSVLRTRTK